MFIKSLTLHGFKAFADKTVVQFDGGIGGLIGPNGCGKSNVIDAIKWAIGEQKSSELRSGKMEDVIFHGAEEKSHSNYAEVEMVIDNQNNLLPLEYNEVSIIRRLYRSGESEYLINKQASRLKDIQALFMDTGIGKSTYSVIEQGKIDRILSDKAEERRYIFEEAAGITKFREKKREYERKTEKTQDNLLRVNDIIRELEKQHGSLQKQAELAEKYFKYQDELKQVETDLMLYKLLQVKSKKIQIDKNLSVNSEKYEKTLSEKEESEAKIKELQSSIKDKEENISSFEKRKIELGEKINSIRENSRMLTQRESETNEQIKLRNEESKETEKEKTDLQQRLNELNDEYKEKSEKNKENQKVIEANKKRLTALEQLISDSEKEIQAAEKRIKEIDKEQSRLNEESSKVVKDFIEEIDSIKARLSSESEKHVATKGDILGQFESLLQQFDLVSAAKSEEELMAWLDQNFAGEKDGLRKQVSEAYLRILEIRQDVFSIQGKVKTHLNEKDPLYETIFSTEGTYAKKEKIDNILSDLKEEVLLCQERLQEYSKEKERCAIEKNKIVTEITTLEIDTAGLEQNLLMIQKIKDEKLANVNAVQTRLHNLSHQLGSLQKALVEVQSKKEENIQSLKNIEKENMSLSKNMDQFYSNISSQTRNLNRHQEKIFKLEQALQDNRDKQHKLSIDSEVLEREIRQIYDSSREQYSVDLHIMEADVANKTFDPEKLRQSAGHYKEEIQKLGRVNPLAKNEFDSLDERLNEMKKQRQDIIVSMEDLTRLSSELNDKSTEQFIKTFKRIHQNFHQIFRRLFNGGKANITLLDESDPLNSGIDIIAQPPGKKFKQIGSLSGGERSLVAVAIMFSIFLVKPAPICLLDEVDAALDKENINRLARMLNEFKSKTQFIIISHNEKTVSIFDYVYGVTMNNGISKILSLKFENQQGNAS